MAKAEIVSTAAKPDDLIKAYNSAVKALSTLGIEMATKKPDPAKIGPMMTKANKKAEFKLGGDAKTIKLTVECDGNVNTLGILNVAAERDAAKQLALMKSLVECGLASKADLQALEKESAPDPKVIANIARAETDARKKIDTAKEEIAQYDRATSYDKAMQVPVLVEDLKAYAKKANTVENLMFLQAVAKNMARDKIIAGFIQVGSKFEINIDSPTRNGILNSNGGFEDAVTEIKQLITVGDLKAVLLPRKQEAKAALAAAEKDLDKLEETKKKLGIR